MTYGVIALRAPAGRSGNYYLVGNAHLIMNATQMYATQIRDAKVLRILKFAGTAAIVMLDIAALSIRISILLFLE
jgi:hypothetical protein